jgi:hypothetical protein
MRQPLKDEINQFLGAIPEIVAEMHLAPDTCTQQYQGEVRQEEQRHVHGGIIALACYMTGPPGRVS